LYSVLLEHYEIAEKSREGIIEYAHAHKGLGLLIRVKYERHHYNRPYLHIALTATASCVPRGFLLYVQVR